MAAKSPGRRWQSLRLRADEKKLCAEHRSPGFSFVRSVAGCERGWHPAIARRAIDPGAGQKPLPEQPWLDFAAEVTQRGIVTVQRQGRRFSGRFGKRVLEIVRMLSIGDDCEGTREASQLISARIGHHGYDQVLGAARHRGVVLQHEAPTASIQSPGALPQGAVPRRSFLWVPGSQHVYFACSLQIAVNLFHTDESAQTFVGFVVKWLGGHLYLKSSAGVSG